MTKKTMRPMTHCRTDMAWHGTANMGCGSEETVLQLMGLNSSLLMQQTVEAKAGQRSDGRQ